MNNLYPDYVAKFYDTIYNQIRSDVDSDYFLKKIYQTNGPVLEVGVGTGRFFKLAIENNADIYGIDISPAMIGMLKSKIEKKYHNRVSVQNITNFKINKKFNLIIAPFRVFMHLLTIDDQINALNNIYNHLSNKGQFIFDLFVPNIDLIKNGMNNEIDFEGEYEKGKSLKRIVSSKSNIITQITDVKMKFEWDNDSGKNSGEWNTQLRFFFKFEIEHLIKLSKLNLVNIYGDYQENALNKNSKDFIIVCSKK